MKQDLNKTILVLFALVAGTVAQADVYIQKTPHRIDFNSMIQENDHKISQLREEIVKASEPEQDGEKSFVQSELSSTSSKPQPVRQLSSSKAKFVVNTTVNEKAGK